MKSRLEKVYSKLPNQKVNLKAQKVTLSIVDNIEQELDRFDIAESDASYLAYDYGDEIMDAYNDFSMKYNIDDYIINGATRDLEEVSEILKRELENLKTKADELGVDVEDVFDGWNDLYNRVTSADALNSDAKSKYREVIGLIGRNDFWK